jgi:hypothetical protein
VLGFVFVFEKRKEQWFLELDEEGLVTARKRRDEHVPPGPFLQRLRSCLASA